MDAEAYRAESRENWESAAAGWARDREAFQRDAMPVSQWMLDAAHLQPGHTVLELAAGVADTGLMAAELVAPGGKAIITDNADAMIEVARARAKEVGATNVEIRPMEAEWIDLPTASVDAVLSRWGYMLLADPEAALRETRRVLRPGGRAALAAGGGGAPCAGGGGWRGGGGGEPRTPPGSRCSAGSWRSAASSSPSRPTCRDRW